MIYWDTWRAVWAGRLICSWRGHDWRHKMYSDLCYRCRISRSRER